MITPKRKKSVRVKYLLAAGLLLVFGAALWVGLGPLPSVEELKDFMHNVMEWLAKLPSWAFALGTGILPAIGFPITPLYAVAGAVYGSVAGLWISFVGMGINLFITYWGGKYLLKQAGNALFEEGMEQLEKFRSEGGWRFVLLVRMIPGLPFMVQNYLLGMSEVALRPYLLVSVIVQSFWILGAVLSGGAVFSGHGGLAITGVGVLVVAGVLTRMLRKRRRTAS